MKISLDWLAQYTPGPLDLQQVADALTNGGLPVESIETRGDDATLDVEVTSNRGDCLSQVGVAREVAALLRRAFHDVAPKVREVSTPATSIASVEIQATDL